MGDMNSYVAALMRQKYPLRKNGSQWPFPMGIEKEVFGSIEGKND